MIFCVSRLFRCKRIKFYAKWIENFRHKGTKTQSKVLKMNRFAKSFGALYFFVP